MRTWCWIFVRSAGGGICCTPLDQIMFQFQMPWQIKQISTYRKSHILMVPSSLPDTSHFPSLLKAIDVTLLECPSKVVSWNHWALPEKMQPMRIHTGSEEVLAMSYIYIFLWIAAAKNRLLRPWAWTKLFLRKMIKNDGLLVRDG